jgi:hypothetical protein
MLILGIWCFMDFKLNFCDRVLHNLFSKLHKETLQTSSCCTDKSKFVEWIFMSGTLLVVNHVCRFGIRGEIQCTGLSFPFGLETRETQFFHRSPRRLAKEKYSVALKVNSLGWPKQASPLLMPQSKSRIYRL